MVENALLRLADRREEVLQPALTTAVCSLQCRQHNMLAPRELHLHVPKLKSTGLCHSAKVTKRYYGPTGTQLAL